MKKETYMRAHDLMVERDEKVAMMCRCGEALEQTDRDNPDSFREFVAALAAVEDDPQVLWNIIDKACEPLAERIKEIDAEIAALGTDNKEPLTQKEINEQKLRVMELITEIEKAIGYKIDCVTVRPHSNIHATRCVEFEIKL